MKNNSLKQLAVLGQSVWLDYIRCDLIAGDDYVSLELNPHLAHDTRGTVRETRNRRSLRHLA